MSFQKKLTNRLKKLAILACIPLIGCGGARYGNSGTLIGNVAVRSAAFSTQTFEVAGKKAAITAIILSSTPDICKELEQRNSSVAPSGSYAVAIIADSGNVEEKLIAGTYPLSGTGGKALAGLMSSILGNSKPTISIAQVARFDDQCTSDSKFAEGGKIIVREIDFSDSLGTAMGTFQIGVGDKKPFKGAFLAKSCAAVGSLAKNGSLAFLPSSINILPGSGSNDVRNLLACSKDKVAQATTVSPSSTGHNDTATNAQAVTATDGEDSGDSSLSPSNKLEQTANELGNQLAPESSKAPANKKTTPRNGRRSKHSA